MKMKRILATLVTVVLLISVVCTAMAGTWDYTTASLKRVVKSNTSNSVVEGEKGNVIVDFSATSTVEIVGAFTYEGNSNRIVNFCVYTDTTLAVSAGDRGKALEAVNKWNVEKRYPKAVVLSDNTVALEGNLMGTDDLTEGVVDEYVSDMLYGTRQFFSFLKDEGFTQFAAY